MKNIIAFFTNLINNQKPKDLDSWTVHWKSNNEYNKQQLNFKSFLTFDEAFNFRNELIKCTELLNDQTFTFEIQKNN